METVIGTNWTTLKNFIQSKALSVQYIDIDNTYRIFTFDGYFSMSCIIEKTGNSDQTDFETNYKPTANSALLGQKIAAKSTPVVMASDQTAIPVTATITSIASTVAPSLSNNIKALPTFAVIAIPSSVSYTTLFTYSGSGYFLGFNHEFNATGIVVKLVIDGKTVFDGNDLAALNSLAVTSNATSRYQAGQGIISAASVIDFSTRYPIAYATSVTISARLTSGAVSKNFQQGIVYIQKDT